MANSISVAEVRERMAQGWSFADAIMGKGWESKYPHIASWRGGHGYSGSEGQLNIWLEASCGSVFTRYATTTYRLAEKHVTLLEDQEAYQVIDEFIRDWIAEHGIETLLRFEKGWMGAANWEVQYPHIARWISRGKRYCVQININLVTHHSRVKAWHYDKAANRETVIFKKAMEGLAEAEVLQMLDAGIESWLREH